jgi:hypothetical protein
MMVPTFKSKTLITDFYSMNSPENRGYYLSTTRDQYNVYIGFATTNKTESTIDMPQQPTEPNQQQTCRNNKQNRINNRYAAITSRHATHTATTNRHAATNWIPIRMTYRPNDILLNRCRLFERRRSPLEWPTDVGLRMTTSRLTGLREMPQQRTKSNQQQTCRNNQQNRINNGHVAITNKIESTTDMPQQATQSNQQQTCHNKQ